MGRNDISLEKNRGGKGEQPEENSRGASTGQTETQQTSTEATTVGGQSNIEGTTIIKDGTPEVLGLASVTKPKRTRKRNTTSAAKRQKEKDEEAQKKSKAEMLSGLLQTATAIGAMRLGDHWAFSKPECDAIADPIIGILDQYNLLDKLDKYGHYVSLGVALSAAVVPRVFMQIEINKELKKQMQRRNEHATQSIQPSVTTAAENTDAGKGGNGGGRIDRAAPDDDATNTKNILAAVVG